MRPPIWAQHTHSVQGLGLLRNRHRLRFRVPSSEMSGPLPLSEPSGNSGAESVYILFISWALNGPHVSPPHPERLVTVPHHVPPSGWSVSGSSTSSSWIPRQIRKHLPVALCLPRPHPVCLQALRLAGASDSGSSAPIPTFPLPLARTHHRHPFQSRPNLQPSPSLGPLSVCSMHVP